VKALHLLEQKITKFSKNYQKCEDESEKELTARNRLHELIIPAIGEYNRILNKVLQKYNQINYSSSSKTKKAVQKAALGYSYHFLDLLMKILRILESESTTADVIDENITLLIEYYERKEELLSKKFYPKAQEELSAFYDSDLRSQLDSNLKKFLDKHQPPRKHRNDST